MAEADSPSWLTGPGEDPPVTQSTANDFSDQEPKVSTVEIDATADATGSTTTATSTTEDEDKDLPGIILIMRLANMGVSIALMICSVCVIVYVADCMKVCFATHTIA